MTTVPLGGIALLAPPLPTVVARDLELITVTDRSVAISWTTAAPDPSGRRRPVAADTELALGPANSRKPLPIVRSDSTPTAFHYVEVHGLGPGRPYRRGPPLERPHPRSAVRAAIPLQPGFGGRPQPCGTARSVRNRGRSVVCFPEIPRGAGRRPAVRPVLRNSSTSATAVNRPGIGRIRRPGRSFRRPVLRAAFVSRTRYPGDRCCGRMRLPGKISRLPTPAAWRIG